MTIKRIGRPPKVRIAEENPGPWPFPKSNPPIASEPEEIFHLPTWVEFAQYVRDNGKFVVKAQYPGKGGETIDTIYAGVPVINGPSAKVMFANSEWAYY